MRTSDWSSDVCSSDLSGKLELYGQNLQIVHPDNVLAPDQADELPEREAVYPLSEGLTNKRMAALAVQALERIPTLPEWVEPSVLSRQVWSAWHEALIRANAAPADASARERLGSAEMFAHQVALMLVRAPNPRRPGL